MTVDRNNKLQTCGEPSKYVQRANGRISTAGRVRAVPDYACGLVLTKRICTKQVDGEDGTAWTALVSKVGKVKCRSVGLSVVCVCVCV